MSLTFDNSCRADLVRIVETLYTTMLRTTVWPSDVVWVTMPDQLVARIHFSGSSNCSLEFKCGYAAACEFLKAMLPRRIGRPSEEDVRDNLGELANMIAGNFKSVLPAGTKLGTPRVTSAATGGTTNCPGLMSELSFGSPAGEFSVALSNFVHATAGIEAVDCDPPPS